MNFVRFGQVPNQEVQASFPEVWRHALWPEDFPAPAIAPAQPMNEPWDLPRPVIVGDEMVVGDLTDHVDALGRECDEKLQQIKGLDKQIRQQEDRLLKMGDYIEGAEQENGELMKEKAKLETDIATAKAEAEEYKKRLYEVKRDVPLSTASSSKGPVLKRARTV